MRVSSSAISGLFGLAGVVIGGTMTGLTAWWQTAAARKGRLAELELELRHERLLRNESAERAAMLELVYLLRRFSKITVEAQTIHEHGKTIAEQLQDPTIQRLMRTGEEFCDLLDKNVSSIDKDLRDWLERVRDGWEQLTSGIGFLESERDFPKECCVNNEDLICMELRANKGVYKLEDALDSMKP
jgi:hypothetical protein